MRVVVDEDLCCGYAECQVIAPQIFEIDPDNRAVVKLAGGLLTADVADQAQRAANACPTKAIRLIETD